jgi:hypothetical protein
MGGACNTDGRDKKFIQYFSWKNLKGRDHLEDLRVDEKIILECMSEKFGCRV